MNVSGFLPTEELLLSSRECPQKRFAVKAARNRIYASHEGVTQKKSDETNQPTNQTNNQDKRFCRVSIYARFDWRLDARVDRFAVMTVQSTSRHLRSKGSRYLSPRHTNLGRLEVERSCDVGGDRGEQSTKFRSNFVSRRVRRASSKFSLH